MTKEEQAIAISELQRQWNARIRTISEFVLEIKTTEWDDRSELWEWDGLVIQNGTIGRFAVQKQIDKRAILLANSGRDEYKKGTQMDMYAAYLQAVAWEE